MGPCRLDIRSDSSIEQCGEGVPGWGHSDGDGEGDGCKDERCCPHRRAVDAANRDEFVDDENEKQDAEAGDGSSGGRQPDASPGKATEGCGNQIHCGDQDEALVHVRPTPGSPGSVDDDGEADDADQWDRSGDGGVERTYPDSSMKRVDGSPNAEHDHDRGKAEGDNAEGTMQFDPPSGDECSLDGEQQHPESEDRAVDVKDGAGKRRAHHACLEVTWREADEDADAEQDRHAAVEDTFDGSVDRPVPGLLG
jgi:hypothetical protein